MTGNAIDIRDLTKAFGANRVLRGVNLSLPAGKVTVLMGANGAGKSTLVKVLSGVHRRDGGEIHLFGKPYDPVSPSAAMAQGVVTVHQSINDGVIPDLDVAANLMLDELARPGSGFFYNRRKVRAQAREIAARIGLDVDIARPVSELPLAERQLVAIARAMAHKPKLLILDEPTSSLSAAEAQRLFALVERLRDSGVAILYISHRMSDIRRLADRIISMRDGVIAGVFEETPLDYEGAVNAMLGHGLTSIELTVQPAGKTVLELRDMRLKPASRPFSLALRENEITAITGLVGAGKTLLANIIFGLERPHAGRMYLDGRPHEPASAGQAVQRGIFMCPKDRASNAVFADFDITRNITLPFVGRYAPFAAFINTRRERQKARQMIETLSIVCQSERDNIMTLSGGNQQKVMVARWLSEPPRVLVLDEPFQGVDIKARRDIGEKIRATAQARATLVLVSEMDEALEVADRIIVMSDHTIAGDHVNHQPDLDLILAQVAGNAAAPAA